MTATVIPFPGQRVIRQPVDRLRVLLDGVHDSWSRREFGRIYNECQMLLTPVQRVELHRDYIEVFRRYPYDPVRHQSDVVQPRKDLR